MQGIVELVSKSLVKNGNNAGDVFYKLQIDGKNYNVFKDSSVYDLVDNDVIVVNQTVEFEFGESKPYDYQGKQVTSKHLVKLVLVEAKSSSNSENLIGLLEGEYREKQIKMMDECFADARKDGRSSDYIEAVAIAFFDKRCSPLFYAKKEGM